MTIRSESIVGGGELVVGPPPEPDPVLVGVGIGAGLTFTGLVAGALRPAEVTWIAWRLAFAASVRPVKVATPPWAVTIVVTLGSPGHGVCHLAAVGRDRVAERVLGGDSHREQLAGDERT